MRDNIITTPDDDKSNIWLYYPKIRKPRSDKKLAKDGYQWVERSPTLVIVYPNPEFNGSGVDPKPHFPSGLVHLSASDKFVYGKDRDENVVIRHDDSTNPRSVLYLPPSIFTNTV